MFSVFKNKDVDIKNNCYNYTDAQLYDSIVYYKMVFPATET